MQYPLPSLGSSVHRAARFVAMHVLASMVRRSMPNPAAACSKGKPLAAFLLLCALGAGQAFAVPGDTTWVRAHNAADMVWYGPYDALANFPDGSTAYARIELHMTLGCASGGCSDWDYTVRLHHVDTVSGVETELGRLITPYGGYMRTNQKGFDNAWTRTFVYDVTDMAGLLQGVERLRAFYDGWSSGFSATLDFAFIEGTPPRDVLDLHVVHHSTPSSWGYASGGTDFDAAHFPDTALSFAPGVQQARLRVTPSGHGFDNSVVCAEFCNRDYTVYVDGSLLATQAMWRDDCGFNPVYPQGGTWLYDRANWCPGSEAWTHFHEFPVASGGVNLNIDLDNYTWSGTQTPGYIWSTIAVGYGAFNINLDAEIADVIKPNAAYAHSRVNPNCGSPEVVLRNNGGQTLTSCTIAYGVGNGPTCYYAWSGSLPYGESENVVLSTPSFGGVDLSNPEFWVRVEGPNGGVDEVSWNDERRVRFDVPPLYSNQFIVWLRTNIAFNETSWRILDDLGNVVASRSSFDGSYTIHEDTVDLPNGCYTFEVSDSGEDGLSFFANSDGTGSLRFLNVGGGAMAAFESDFGSGIVHGFTTGLPLGAVNSAEACDVSSIEDQSLNLNQSGMELWLSPNPAQDRLRVDWWQAKAAEGRLLLVDLQGRVLEEVWLKDKRNGQTYLDLQAYAPGTYTVLWIGPAGKISKRVELMR